MGIFGRAVPLFGVLTLLPHLAAAQPVTPPPVTEPPPAEAPPPPVAPAEVPATVAPPPAEPPPPAAPGLPQPTRRDAPADEPAGEDAVQAALTALQALHVSGYIQAQYEVHEDSENELGPGGTLLNFDRFRIRRGRLKFEYVGIEHALFTFEIDANSEAVGLREGTAAVIEPWTGWSIELAAGLFKIPFGYENLQSHSNLVFPESSVLGRTLFPGERDVGIRLKGKQGLFNFQLALINGEPIGERTFPGRDPNSYKDFSGRLGLDTELIDFGVSGYVGTEFVAGTPAVSGTSVWFDENGDGAVDPDEVTTTDPAAAVPSANAFRARLGADLELETMVPGLGKLLVYGEGAYAHLAGVRGATATNQILGYVAAVQNLTDLFGIALRFDMRDPNIDARADKVYTLTPVLLAYPVPAVRVSLAYDIVVEEGPSIANNILTARMQLKF